MASRPWSSLASKLQAASRLPTAMPPITTTTTCSSKTAWLRSTASNMKLRCSYSAAATMWPHQKRSLPSGNVPAIRRPHESDCVRSSCLAFRVGIDVGGTFTDFLLMDEEGGKTFLFKTPSTPHDPSEGVLLGLQTLLKEAQVSPGDVDQVMHGTTVATNAVLEGRGAKVGLLCTEGFEQVLHLARGKTPGPLAGWVAMIKPEPLAALENTRGVRERISARGEVVLPLDDLHALEAVDQLVEAGIESLAISLINSYANREHEQRLRDMVHERYPELSISISSEVLPEFREYERTNVVVMNAYVRPRLSRYLELLRSRVEQLGVRGSVSILRSDGGLMTLDSARESPVNALLAGPAGGVASAAMVAASAGYQNFLSLDMGGTSTD